MKHEEWCKSRECWCPTNEECRKCKIAYEAEPAYTSEKPKVPGWYWVDNGVRPYITLIEDGERALINAGKIMRGWRFSGPIQEPREP